MKKPRFVLYTTAFFILLFIPQHGYSQAKVPRFENSPCPTPPFPIPPAIKLECGFLVVAQDRAKPDGRTFRLMVAILRAVPRSTMPPLVITHGGPSGPGGVAGPESLRALTWVPKLKRDIIVYDQRGAGLSEPGLCPEAYAQPEKYLQATTDKEREDTGLGQARECIAELRRSGVDPDMFSSEVNGLDLIDLRKALGVSKWDIVGTSYGGRVVQEMLRLDPSGVRSVVMNSPSIVAAGSQSDIPLTRQRLVERVFAMCKAQPECASTFPTFESDFYAVYRELNEQPMDVVVDDLRGEMRIRLDGLRFIRTATNPMNIRISKLPLLIKEFRTGDRVRAARYLVGRRLGGGIGNNALTELVNCYDGYGPVYARRVAEIRKMVRPEFRALANDLEQCPTWHTRFAASKEQRLVKSNVPALIVSSELDDRTSTEHGKLIASALKNSHHFELPGVTHGNGIGDGCGETIVMQFLQAPNRKPDTSCIATMPTTKFELRTLQAQTLFFAITSEDGRTHPLTGTWGAIYPAIETPVTFVLKARGDSVTGTYRASGRQFEIFEGTISTETISFSIRSPTGDRTIRFTGRLSGEEIIFQRDVVIRPGGRAGGAFLWGSAGPKSFAATRAESAQ